LVRNADHPANIVPQARLCSRLEESPNDEGQLAKILRLAER
jgi:hypothetical protein